MMYNKQISSSDNKLKTTWQIIHSQTGREIKHGAIQCLTACNSISHKKQNIAEMLSDKFLTTADTTNNKVFNNSTDNNSPNTDNNNFMFLTSQEYSKNYPSIYSNHLQHKK